MTDPIELLRSMMTGRSLRTTAKDLGISAAYLSDILTLKRPVGPKVLAALGIEKQVTYRKSNGRRVRKSGGNGHGR